MSEQASGAAREGSAVARTAEPADILHRLLKLNNRLMAPFATHLEKQHRITVNGFRVLMLIGRLGVTASHELVDILGVNPMSVHRAVQSLHGQGRIAIEPDTADSRRKSLRLTAEGQRLYRRMLPTTDIVVDYLFSLLSPAEVAQFDRMITTLIGGLEARDEAGRSIFIERTRPQSSRAAGPAQR
ncbi:MAG TPA: MarR family winged helix-turn-helix transcriptional regulator [Caulobacteraceae bacterium]